MAEILEELKRIDNGAGIDSDLLDIIQIMTQTYNGLAEKEKSWCIGKYKRTRKVW